MYFKQHGNGGKKYHKLDCFLVAIYTSMVSALNANDAKIILLERFQEITVTLQDVKIRPQTFFTVLVMYLL